MPMGRQRLLLDGHVSAWNSPEVEAAIHQKWRAASPREWARWLALRGCLAKTILAIGSAKNHYIACIEVIIIEMRTIRNKNSLIFYRLLQ